MKLIEIKGRRVPFSTLEHHNYFVNGGQLFLKVDDSICINLCNRVVDDKFNKHDDYVMPVKIEVIEYSEKIC